MQAGVGELVRRAGLAMVRLLAEQEVEELVGKRSVRTKDRKADRWAKTTAGAGSTARRFR